MSSLPASLPAPSRIVTRCLSTAKRVPRGRGVRNYPKGRVERDQYEIVWNFTESEYQTWEVFYRETINKGQDWFDMQIYDGQTEVTQTVRLLGPAKTQDASPLMAVSISVECDKRAVMSSVDVDTALGV